MTLVEIESVTVLKSGRTILDDVTLTAPSGQVLAVIGPSGSGKTTLLRAIAGLDEPDAGSVRFDGEEQVGILTSERDVAMVLQTNVVYPRRDVRRQISFPLEVRHVKEPERSQRVDAEARVVGIGRELGSLPETLAVGQLRLTQVARALVRNPRVFLMDEPFHSLDAKLRAEARAELITLQRGYGVTMIVTTNDPVSAMAIGDQIAMIDAGRLRQVGPPSELYDAPATIDVARMLGEIAVIDAVVEGDREGAWLVAPGLRMRAWRPELRGRDGDAVRLGLRPTWINAATGGHLTGVVESCVGVGPDARSLVRIGDQRVEVAGRSERGAAITLAVEHAVVFDGYGELICPIPA